MNIPTDRNGREKKPDTPVRGGRPNLMEDSLRDMAVDLRNLRSEIQPNLCLSYRGWRVRRRPRLGGGDVGQVLDDFLRVLRLARPRLARAEDALVLPV